MIVRLSREIHANEEQRVFLWDPDQENKKTLASFAPSRFNLIIFKIS